MTNTIALWDDGKGRRFIRKEADEKPDIVSLVLKPDWREATKPGEYGWDKIVGLVEFGGYILEKEKFEVLVLNCPFCGFSTPVPWTVQIQHKEPLTLEESLYCIRCETSFYVIEGKAIRSWGVLEATPLLGRK